MSYHLSDIWSIHCQILILITLSSIEEYQVPSFQMQKNTPKTFIKVKPYPLKDTINERHYNSSSKFLTPNKKLSSYDNLSSTQYNSQYKDISTESMVCKLDQAKKDIDFVIDTLNQNQHNQRELFKEVETVNMDVYDYIKAATQYPSNPSTQYPSKAATQYPSNPSTRKASYEQNTRKKLDEQNTRKGSYESTIEHPLVTEFRNHQGALSSTSFYEQNYSLRRSLNEEIQKNNTMMQKIQLLEDQNQQLQRRITFGPIKNNQNTFDVDQLLLENQQLKEKISKNSILPQQLLHEMQHLKRQNQALRSDTLLLLRNKNHYS